MSLAYVNVGQSGVRERLRELAVGERPGAACFFTSSASFANPAISVGRMFSNTFAGIASYEPARAGAQISR